MIFYSYIYMYVCMYVYVCLCVCLCVNMPKNDILRSMPYVYAYYLYYNLYITNITDK